MSQLNTLAKHATSVKYDLENGVQVVTLYATEIVRFTPRVVYLNTGGYLTATTAVRMNQSANQFGLGYHINRRQGKFFISFPNGNGWEFKADGTTGFNRLTGQII